MRGFHNLLMVAIPVLMMAGCAEKMPVYKDPEQPVEKRVRDLLSRMTIQEKMAQMVAANEEVRDSIFIGEEGSIDLSRMKPLLKDGIGQITRLSETKGETARPPPGWAGDCCPLNMPNSPTWFRNSYWRRPA